MNGIFSTLHAIARTGYLPQLHSFTVVAYLSLVQNDWQKGGNCCGKFKQEPTVLFVIYTTSYSENRGDMRI